MDMKASQMLMDCLPEIGNKVVMVKGNYSTEDFLSIIGCFRLLIGMRLHALIFAAVMKVPLMAVSYDPKVDSFVKEIGARAVGTVENLEAGNVETAADALWGNALVEQEARICAMRKLAQSNAVKAFELLHK